MPAKSTLVSDLKKIFKKEYPSGGSFQSNIQAHAGDFADAIDDYVKALKDPADRKPQSTTKSIIKSSVVSGFSPNPAPDSDTAAELAAVAYGTAISSYISTIQLDKSPISASTQKIVLVTPSGNVTVATVSDKGSMNSIKTDFKKVFTKEHPKGTSADSIADSAAEDIADAIAKVFKDKVSISISGMDSSLPPPAGPGPQSFSSIGEGFKDE